MSLFLSGSQTIIENVFAYVFLLIFGNRIIFSWDVRMESRQTAFVALPSTAWANCRCLHITVSGDTFVDHCVSSCSGGGSCVPGSRAIFPDQASMISRGWKSTVGRVLYKG